MAVVVRNGIDGKRRSTCHLWKPLNPNLSTEHRGRTV
jgi:hypothetical protein